MCTVLIALNTKVKVNWSSRSLMYLTMVVFIFLIAIYLLTLLIGLLTKEMSWSRRVKAIKVTVQGHYSSPNFKGQGHSCVTVNKKSSYIIKFNHSTHIQKRKKIYNWVHYLERTLWFQKIIGCIMFLIITGDFNAFIEDIMISKNDWVHYVFNHYWWLQCLLKRTL